MDIKTALGFISAAAAALVGLYPYIHSTVRGKTAPHAFTWATWTILTVMIFIIQVAENAGPGAWGTGMTALACIAILIPSLIYGVRTGSRWDWLALCFSLGTIPLWLFTTDPLWSAILVTIIDVVAFYPTVSKTWARPHSEHLFYFWTWLVKFPASLLALREMTLVNALYPAVWSAIAVLFVGGTLLRRRMLEAVQSV